MIYERLPVQCQRKKKGVKTQRGGGEEGDDS